MLAAIITGGGVDPTERHGSMEEVDAESHQQNNDPSVSDKK